MIPKNIEDIQLITKVIEGCKKSENLLYAKYRKIIINFINRKYPNNQDVDDDASDILMKIIENLHLYDQNMTQFNTWVFSITKNHMIDKLKKNKPIYTTFNFYDDQSSTSYDSDYFTTSTQAICEPHYTTIGDFESNDSLNYISSQITSTDFHMLMMKYSDGYDYNEISKEFNVTSSTVSNRVNYVKSKIKKMEIFQ
jgi:RNA polymerase sigma factor (sigma-70 family)